jgi:alpha-D-glucose phosphate-specific phosphoglucomutase
MIKFGTDGWRGVIGEDFTFHNVRVVSQAIADYVRSQRGKRLVIGYDTRFLSREFAMTCSLVLAANGIRVDISSEVVPTPVVSFSTLQGKYDLGIMITASHNPYKFNGLKIKTKDGGAADRTLTDKVERFLFKNRPKSIDVKEAKAKHLLKERELTKNYKDFLKNFVNIKKIRDLRLKVLIDLMYGTGDTFAQDVISSRNLKIDYLHNEFNPCFGGRPPEPVEDNLDELIKRVKRGGYDLGVALDGDGDRIALVDNKGNFVNAQIILPLLAIHVIKNRKKIAGIGKTVVGTALIDRVALSLGASCFETPVGFKYISNLFKEKLISIGGEEAGGIGFQDFIPERDGTASLLMILEMIAYEGKPLATLINNLYKKFGTWFYARISIPLDRVSRNLDNLKLPSHLLGQEVERINLLDGIKLLTSQSWLMFRKSGTEPIVRIYAEAKTRSKRDALLALGKKLIHTLT